MAVPLQTWSAPIFKPTPTRYAKDDPHYAPEMGDPDRIIEDGRPGLKLARIEVHAPRVQHRKEGRPDAHARRIRQRLDVKIEETYLNRHFLIEHITGSYAGTDARVRLVDSDGDELAAMALTTPGPFVLTEQLEVRDRGFVVTLEHQGDDYEDGHVDVAFRQEETEAV